MSFEKLERDGKIAVIYSPGYGAGWFTCNSGHEGLIFDREIAEAVLAEDRSKAIAIAENKYPGVYTGGGEDLDVVWLDKGTAFLINEYDGYESVETASDLTHIA